MVSGLRRAAARGVLLLAGLAVGLLLVEAGLRLFLPPRPGTEMRALHVLRPDRPWLYEMRPGAHVRSADGIDYAINADGFRGPLVPQAKPPGTFRVVVVGDSLSFGYGVPEDAAFPMRLGVLLAARPGAPAVDVVDLGVSGYNPYTEAALFAGRGVAWHPDLVLVQFCVNDLNDPTMHFDTSTAVRLGTLPDEAFPDPTTRHTLPPRPFDCRGWRICRLIAHAVRPAAPTDPATLRAALLMHEEPSARELAWLAARYAEIDRTARAAGARVALLVFPFQGQLDGPDAPPLQAALRGVAERLGWLTIDLLPALRAAAAGGRSPFLDPWHPTAAGHAAVARAIARRLACAGLVPGAAPADCEAP